MAIIAKANKTKPKTLNKVSMTPETKKSSDARHQVNKLYRIKEMGTRWMFYYLAKQNEVLYTTNTHDEYIEAMSVLSSIYRKVHKLRDYYGKLILEQNKS